MIAIETVSDRFVVVVGRSLDGRGTAGQPPSRFSQSGGSQGVARGRAPLGIGTMDLQDPLSMAPMVVGSTVS